MRYRLAQHVRLKETDGESFLICSSPLRVLRLNRPLRDLIRRLIEGTSYQATPAGSAILEQLAIKGFVLRTDPAHAPSAELPTVSIVIPVKDRASELQRCLQSIARIEYPPERLQLIVVDDGSRDDSWLVALRAGATVVSSGGTGRGPAAARNAGASEATGDILAFVDSDCTVSTGWLAELVPAFDDPAVAAVGGQVAGMCMQSQIDRYEAVMSSLSLGTRERVGNSGNDTFYLPSCNLLARKSLFLEAGGFNEEMHVGEDVDLTWRLRDNGWTITYLPSGAVYHEHRSTIPSFMVRRFEYGTSEAMLHHLHPKRRKRMVTPPMLAVAVAMAALTPVTPWALGGAVAAFLVDILSTSRSLETVPIGLAAMSAARLRTLCSMTYYLDYHLVRYYSVFFVPAALFLPWLWLPCLALVLYPAGVDFKTKRLTLSFAAFAAIYLLDHLAYGSGVLWGCVRQGRFGSYRICFSRSGRPDASGVAGVPSIHKNMGDGCTPSPT